MKKVAGDWAVQLVIIFAVGAGLLVYTSTQDSDKRDQLIRGCERTAVRAALNARAWEDASATRRASGTPADIKAANKYLANARGQLYTIAAPKGYEGSPLLARTKVVIRNKKAVQVLTPQSSDLQRQGCERAFP